LLIKEIGTGSNDITVVQTTENVNVKETCSTYVDNQGGYVYTSESIIIYFKNKKREERTTSMEEYVEEVLRNKVLKHGNCCAYD
jgi:hypothetical protein